MDKQLDLRALLAAREHLVSIIVNGKQVVGWIDYSIESSMITPADSFSLSRPFDREVWAACPADSDIKVLVDGAPIITGIVDARSKNAASGTMEIRGRDRAGRLVQESAPRANYSGLTMHSLIFELAKPWFSEVTLSGARDRDLRRGKGRHHAASGNEPIILKTLQSKYGKVEPGMLKWQLIQQICSQVGILAWSSGDGTELILAKPNYNQGVQYVFRHAAQGSSYDSNVLDMTFTQDLGDVFAHILCVGSGGSTDEDYGNVYRAGWNHDGPKPDGTGNRFRLPKSLIMTEQAIRSNEEAKKLAIREHARRLFKSETMSVEVPFHGQTSTGLRKTLFAVNTIAHVTDEEIDYKQKMLVHTVRFEGSREGERTVLDMVPEGTEIVQ